MALFRGRKTGAAAQATDGANDAWRGAFWLQYPLFAFLWLAVLWLVADSALGMGLSVLLCWTFVLAIPPALLQAQQAHLRRSDMLRHWRTGSWWHGVLAGARLRPVVALAVSAFAVLWLIVHLAIEPSLWGGVLWVAVLLPLAIGLVRARLRASLRPAWLGLWPVRFGVWITVGLVVLGAWQFGSGGDEAPTSLHAARARLGRYEGDSALLDLLFEYATFTSALMAYGFALAGREEAEWAGGLRLLTLLLKAGLLFAAARGLAVFTLPRPQLRLGLARVGENPASPPDPTRRQLMAQGVSATLLAGVTIVGLRPLDSHACAREWPRRARIGTMFVEEIDGQRYPEGTSRLLGTFEGEARKLLNTAQHEAASHIRSAFDQARKGVDAWLDWRFSVARDAAKLSAGAVRQLMDDQRLGNLQEQIHVAFARLEGTTNALHALHQTLTAELNARVVPDESIRTQTVRTSSRAELVPTLERWKEAVPFDVRMTAAGGVTVVGAGLVSTTVVQAAGRRLAVPAQATRALRFARWLIPGVAGGAGLAAGILLGLFLDWLLLRVNEAAGREQLRKAILDELQKEEQRLFSAIASLSPPASPPAARPPVIPLRCQSGVTT